MALQTTTEIFISGTAIRGYVNLRLVQEIDAHHDLELVCRTDVVEKLSEELIGDSKEYLGGIITIRISSISELGAYKELEFKGVVTKVKATKGFQNATGDLVTIFAKSSSILSDDGAHYASFQDVGLIDILDQTFQEYDKGKLETNFAPVSSDTIHYSVQHNQSAFNYASRLAAYHNEWFYYDGQKLVFGNPSNEETELSYGVDLQDFTVELSSVPNSFDYFTNDYFTDEIHTASSTKVAIPSEGYHGFTDKKSKELFAKQTQVYHNLYNDTSIKSRLDTQIDQYTRSRAMKQVIAKGSSDNPGVNLGQVIKIKGYGSYRIIKITHTNIEGGSYKNTFEAVDANFSAYPKMDISKYPKSDVQIATVIENNDPSGMGRIKVQFPWQKHSGETTPWLRMMTPHAGSDKGFHFIPENGEEIIVGFESGNAERPFILGSLYHGTAKPDSWQTDANDIKAIKTRSGHLIELHDTDGSEKILISDKNSNLVRIDTANNNIEISAMENMTLNAKNIEINAQEEIKMNAGTNMLARVTENLSINAKNGTEMIEENKTLVAKEILENADKVVIESTKENMELVSSKQVDIKGNDNIKLF
ncbi:phage baseplate assembly protein V [uncultured Aquimarina sp.]|uniref:type VI secretion system Vgr family protein n=1 Tax=uncultured Aquimarina sp. TaxID=575652 RepID=UPI00260B9401|nr:phage baseplate assembly protein V [uncultured Aquimarina sp.]